MATECSYWLFMILCLTGAFASDWSVHVPSGPICALIGSTVVLPCSYDYPQSSNDSNIEGGVSAQVKQEYAVVSEMWCLGDSQCITERYVFHSDGIFPEPSYKDRVKYLGSPGTKNCSLQISDLTISDSGTYVFYLITSHPNEKMPAQSGVQLLVASDSSSVPVLASPSSVITEGTAVRLACCSPKVNSQARFTWRSSRSNTQHNGQVWEFSAVSSDKSGDYHCQIQTGDENLNSGPLNVNVQYAPRNVTISVWHPREQQDKLPVTLTCSSHANPPVETYTWYQGTECLPTTDKSFHRGRQTRSTFTGKGSTFSSANITSEVDGWHCCVARNRHGYQMYSLSLGPFRTETSSGTSVGRVVVIGTTIAILLAIFVIVGLLLKRARMTNRHHQTYVLTETTATST